MHVRISAVNHLYNQFFYAHLSPNESQYCNSPEFILQAAGCFARVFCFATIRVIFILACSSFTIGIAVNNKYIDDIY